MAENSNGTSPTLAFIVGGLVVAVGVLVYYLYSPDAGRNDLNIKIDLPEVKIAPKSGG